MRLRNFEARGRFTTIFYDLTWPVNWELCLTFGNVLLHRAYWDGPADGSHPITVEIGPQPGYPAQDITALVAQGGYDLFKTALPQDCEGYLVVTGHAAAYHADMRISIWNGTNQCLFQFRDDPNGGKSEGYYNRFADSMEIWMHVETVKRSYENKAK